MLARTRIDPSHAVPATSRFLGVAAFGVMFLALLWFPWPYHERLLDDGWSLALALFMKSGARAGVDYVFTYGPLGYLAVPALVPSLFTAKYIWTVVFAAVGALAVVRTSGLFGAAWLQAAWLWLALLSLPRTENRFFVVLLLVAALPILERDFRARRLLATVSFLAIVSLIKFTYFAFASALVVFLGVAAPSRGRGVAVGGYVGALVASWLACGQSLFDLPRYVGWSLSLASGYSEAMSQAGDPRVTLAAGAGVASVFVGLVLLRPPRSRLAVFGMVLAGALLSFKEAFVRQDPDHALVFFGYVALASAGCLPLATHRAGRAATAALLLPAALSVVVPVGVRRQASLDALVPSRSLGDAWDSAVILVAPWRYLAKSEHEVGRGAREWSLPRVAERVGREAIDVVTVDQSVVFYNGFEYRPRPVFQSYSAYTPSLAQLNAASSSATSARRSSCWRGGRRSTVAFPRRTTVPPFWSCSGDTIPSSRSGTICFSSATPGPPQRTRSSWTSRLEWANGCPYPQSAPDCMRCRSR